MQKYHAAFLAFVVMACAVNDENVGSSNFDSVTAGTSTSVDNPSGTSTTVSDFNLSGAFSTAGSPATPFWFVGYEDHLNASIGWATATSASGPYTTCFDDSGSCNAVDKGSITFDHWSTNPQPSAAANGSGLVAYAAVYASTSGADHDQIMLMIGDNGGAHIGQSSGQAFSVTADAADGCDSGEMRGPYVTFDQTADPSTPVMWVVWGIKGAGSWGGCVRTFTVDLDTIQPGGPVPDGHSIGNMDREGLDDGQGGLIVQAADGMATVAYSNQDNVPSDTTGCNSNTGLAWETTSTTDGSDWATSSTVLHTSSFDWCALGDTDGTDDSSSRVIKNRREFDFVLASDGVAYVAVNDTNDTIRLFSSVTRGIKIPNMGATNDSPWREYCNELGVDGVGMAWTPPGQACTSALVSPGTEVFRPMLSADGNGRVSLAWYQRDNSLVHGPGFAKVMYLGNVAPRVGSSGTPWQASSGPIQGAFQVAGADPHNSLGWYNTMPSSQATGAGCVGTNDVQPYWVIDTTTPEQNIETRSMTLTP